MLELTVNKQREGLMYLVLFDLELQLHDRGRDVVHKICSTHLSTFSKQAAQTKTPAKVWIVWIANSGRCRFDDISQIDKVLDSGCGQCDRREDYGSDEHGDECCVFGYMG